MATALLPRLPNCVCHAAASACAVCAVLAAMAGCVTAVAVGGVASVIPLMTTSLLDSNMSW
jgi:hypothetical protein